MKKSECAEKVIALFKDAFPGINVSYSYPDGSRPSMPYVVLDFGRVDRQNPDESIKDGLLDQQWRMSMPFTAELVRGVRTAHAENKKQARLQTSAEDMMQAVMYLQSPYAQDRMTRCHIWVSDAGGPEPIYNSVPGVDRARCSFRVDFLLDISDYNALEQNAEKAGYFTEVEIQNTSKE